MTVLTGKTPTPTEVADAWVDAFGDSIRDAAGADGRLTRAEARKIDRRSDAGWMASDNAVNWLKFSGQKTVSAEKLIRKIHDYVERKAEKVAGGNNKVSLVEARKLPADLRADFFFLRGKGSPKHRSGAELSTLARGLVKAALEPFSMTKLPKPPATVRGERSVGSVPFPGDTGAQAHVYVGRNNVIYASVGATASSPNLSRVGWYRLGPVPPL